MTAAPSQTVPPDTPVTGTSRNDTRSGNVHLGLMSSTRTTQQGRTTGVRMHTGDA